MSEFHNAFYRICSVHEIEHPKWRKCPKCEEKIVYSEEEVLVLLHKYNNNPHTPMFPKGLNKWFYINKKK